MAILLARGSFPFSAKRQGQRSEEIPDTTCPQRDEEAFSDVRNLLEKPAWQEADLGFPLPDSPHACSVCLPTWDSVVGYEEGRERVVKRLRTGYPRFFRHPSVQRIFDDAKAELAGENEDVLVLPTKFTAQRAQRWLEKNTEKAVRATSYNGFQALVFPDELSRLALHYWRFSGSGISSRLAEDFFDREIREESKSHLVARAFSNFTGGTAENTFIFSSGIAAGLAALQSLPRLKDGKKTLQIEFPYVDTLKIQEQFGNGVVYLDRAEGEPYEEALQRIRAAEFAGVFTEVPSNPLLRTIDLIRLSEACRSSGTPLILDDSSVGPLNVNVLPYCDVLTSSLTKWVSGTGDVMAGAITLRTDSKLATELRENIAYEANRSAPCYVADAEVLLSNFKGYTNRNTQVNQNSEALVQFLDTHGSIDQVYHPSLTTTEHYNAIKRKNGGYGGLMSFTLKNPKKAQKVYDALEVSKGPSFGTAFTLACPYTLLAHWSELEWAEDCGVSQNLIRVSVGLESAQEIIERFSKALA